MSNNLSVYLNDALVGVLTQLLDGRIYLAFDEKYKSNQERLTLSLSYKAALSEIGPTVPPPAMNLPPFFSHLLPEGRLRQYLAREWGFKETQEFKLLRALGEDLPGAVILKAEGDYQSGADLDAKSAIGSHQSESLLRFSLAGVQLKFSGNKEGDKLVIPACGVGGHWIVKLPSLLYPNVVELEYSMLTLARAAGIVVPDFHLVPTDTIANLPKDLPESLQGDSLISKRFDRTDSGARIHMEDFAQVFGVRDKYDSALNYQSIAYVIWQEIGLEATLEFVRRLVFVVLTGNADMHLKNWSLIYPGGRRAKLAPAYDLVSTIVYPEITTELPHKIAGVTQFQRIDCDVFKAFARAASLPTRSVLACVSETVDAVKETWLAMKNDLPIPASFVRLIDEHIGSVPIATEQATTIPVSTPVPIGMTWPGSFVNWQFQLDSSVPDGQIIYRNQAGEQAQFDAPRRMAHVLLQRQIHELLASRKDFANQLIIGFAGKKLYDEWRKETFVRLPERHVLSEIDQDKLMQPELTLKVAFMPIAWRKLQEHIKQGDQYFDLDFVLDNGELWGLEVTVAALGSPVLRPDGRRISEIKLYVRKATKLYIVPPEQRLIYGPDGFSFE